MPNSQKSGRANMIKRRKIHYFKYSDIIGKSEWGCKFSLILSGKANRDKAKITCLKCKAKMEESK